MIHFVRTGDAHARALLIAVMLGGALFGFLAAGAVGWLLFGPSPKFALWGASVGFLLVLMGDRPEFLKRHLTVNVRRSFWAGYLLALGKLTMGVVVIVLMLLLFVVAITIHIAVTSSVTDPLTLAGDMIGFWAHTSLRVVAGVWLTSAASIALLTIYVVLRRKLTRTAGNELNSDRQ